MDSLVSLVLIAVLVLLLTGCIKIDGGKLNSNDEGFAHRIKTISGPKLYNDSCHRGYPCNVDGPYVANDHHIDHNSSWQRDYMGISPAMAGTVYRENQMLNCKHSNPADCDCGKVSDVDFFKNMHGS